MIEATASRPSQSGNERRRWGRGQRRHRGRGQALVEFALILPVALAIFGTVLDFGRLFYARITLEDAARQGALAAAMAPGSYLAGQNCTTANATTNRITCAVQNESAGSMVSIAPGDITVVCVTSGGSTVSCTASPQLGVRSRVSVTGRFVPLMPFISAIVGNPVLMTSSIAADQQSLPSAALALPTPTAVPTPTATATATATATSTATATASPSPSPTPPPCVGPNIPVPDLVNGAAGVGTAEDLSDAKKEWATAGFSSSNFNPDNSPIATPDPVQQGKIVVAQWADSYHTATLDPGSCKTPGTSVWVEWR